MQDLMVNLENKPGTLAQMGEVLGAAGINIEGIAGMTDPAPHMHVLVESAQLAREALKDAGIECGGEREVEVISVIDQPGEMGRILRKVADGGINVDLVYMATSTRLVLGSEDVAALRAALHAT